MKSNNSVIPHGRSKSIWESPHWTFNFKRLLAIMICEYLVIYLPLQSATAVAVGLHSILEKQIIVKIIKIGIRQNSEVYEEMLRRIPFSLS